jgi:hypothetical protein
MTHPRVQRFIEKYGRVPTEFDRDYLEMLRMEKYSILDIPNCKPFQCANCGSTKDDGRKYVDFGLDIDWYGIVYICGMCLKDIATAFGLFKELEEKLEKTVKTLAELNYTEQKGVELQEKVIQTLKEFEEYYVNLHPAITSSSFDGSHSVESYLSPNYQTPIKDERSVIEPKSRAVKSTTSSGRTNVPSLADLLKSDTDS